MRDYCHFFQFLIALLMCYSHPARSLTLPAPTTQASRQLPVLVGSAFCVNSALPIPKFQPQAPGTIGYLRCPFWPQRQQMWLPSQDIDVPIAAGSSKPELYIELARNLQEDGDAGQAHLQRNGSNVLISLSLSPPPPRRNLLLQIGSLS